MRDYGCPRRMAPTTTVNARHRAEKRNYMKNHWLEIDKEGLQKSLGQKNKVFLLTEMVSNAWDEDITRVEVTLSRPNENNHSWLRVTDNSPTGWSDLSHSHTMFAESTKKGKSEKRGRLHAGEK